MASWYTNFPRGTAAVVNANNLAPSATTLPPSGPAGGDLTGTYPNPTIGPLDASKITTGIIPVARGGTNSTAALTNGKIMVSSAGAIVEGTSSTTPGFQSEILTATSNQLTLGNGNTTTINALAPAASRVLTIADPGANSTVVVDTASALAITNAGTVGQVLKLATATTATWQAESAGSGLSLFENFMFAIYARGWTAAVPFQSDFTPAVGFIYLTTFRAITTASGFSIHWIYGNAGFTAGTTCTFNVYDAAGARMAAFDHSLTAGFYAPNPLGGLMFPFGAPTFTAGQVYYIAHCNGTGGSGSLRGDTSGGFMDPSWTGTGPKPFQQYMRSTAGGFSVLPSNIAGLALTAMSGGICYGMI